MSTAESDDPVQLHSNEDEPFDFNVFLDQLRHKSSDAVVRYVRSFLTEFKKRQWTVTEQVRIISDFMTFIEPKLTELLSTPSSANSMEGLEKLICTKLFTYIYSPAIHHTLLNGSHLDDIERDRIFDQKVLIFSWVGLKELDFEIPSTKNLAVIQRFLDLSGTELFKINNYKAPRDKIICVLNCCKVLFGLLRHIKSEESADKFLPLLIHTLLHHSPSHLISNLQYISRFRSSQRMHGESGYYISSLMGAVSFIENIDHTNVNCSKEEFDKKVEGSVAKIAERLPETPPPIEEEMPELLDTPTDSARQRVVSNETILVPEPQIDGERDVAIENLALMFPDLDRDIILDVLSATNGRVGAAVDICLDLIGDG